MRKQVKREKIPDLLLKVRICLDEGRYRFVQHAIDRRKERNVTLPDVIEVLRNGYHEKAKDTWENAFQAWNYSIRGETIDRKRYRIIVSFEQNELLLIITVIDLDKEDV